ncbi:MAG: hypothetical protein A2788_02205 [Candidatus Abawacabacteria bacterium RIFCSPHIGHO2_01_FULL_46_8]|uniref:FAD/NAD(P)-binding domain-containing protein n=1 Tax=Candidatus Abawacabacteria bacterium RIFCSPHIGHO2_01_FULL_46_8 TaxID=1817815 RepID=A0A1F4XL22_9BACT|nr:MAG: hypothetical protein A2788_02205 [Candidatus Abawacabacteria bacterium RIFCSPHIGHO2_01_FULL_46_8]
MIYDVIIIGGGPGGLNAALYAARYGLKPVVFAEQIGGAVAESVDVQNYLGFISITGLELTEKFKEHALHYGTDIFYDRVNEVKKEDDKFVAKTMAGKTYEGRTLLLATGTKHRILGIPGEEKFKGKGVAYCATCEGFFYKNKVVCTVGGGDSSFTAAIYLAKIAKQVYLIHRGKEDTFRAENIWLDAAKQQKNLAIILENELTEIKGDKFVQEIILKNPYQGKNSLAVDGIFVEIGSAPDPTLPKQLGLDLNERELISTKPDQSTNIPGIYAAGENTTGTNQYNQIVTASAEGAIAAHSISQYLSKNQK